MGWVLLTVFIVLGLLHSLWWWIPAGMLTIWQVHQWHFYNGRPWRKVHYPIMRAFYRAAGGEMAAAEIAGRPLERREAVNRLLRTLKPEWDDEQRGGFVDEQILRCESFKDERLVIQEFRRRNPKFGDSDEKRLSELARHLFDHPDTTTIVQFIAAALIEERYGIQDRGEYLVEVLSGRAK